MILVQNIGFCIGVFLIICVVLYVMLSNVRGTIRDFNKLQHEFSNMHQPIIFFKSCMFLDLLFTPVLIIVFMLIFK